MILVPLDTPGRHDRPQPAGVRLPGPRGPLRDPLRRTCGCPVTNVLGEEGGGFAIAQARLGPGRIHHCMRSIGAGRAGPRADVPAGARTGWRSARPLAEQGVIQEWIADSRIEIEQARLLTLKAAWLMDTVGNKGAAHRDRRPSRWWCPNMALRVIDRAIQAHGGGGRLRRLPARRHVRRHPHPAPGRRARRGAPHGHRPPRAAQAPARRRRGTHLVGDIGVAR